MKQQSCGTWASPVTPGLVVQDSVRLGNICFDSGILYWNEQRPEEKGRSVICKYVEGQIEGLTPADYNVRTRVNEYGGGAFAIHNGINYFVNDEDQRIYIQVEEKVEPFSPVGYRFADLVVTIYGVIAVAEVDTDGHEPECFLALVRYGTSDIVRLAEGHNFFASPAIDADGEKIAWLTWDHPDMPWDNTTLWCADFEMGQISNVTKVCGGQGESVFQPQWSPDAELFFVSDRNNWWNIYRFDGNEVTPVCEMEAEFALPQWVFKMSTWAFAGDQIVAAYTQNGAWKLCIIDPGDGSKEDLDLEYNYYSQIRAEGDTVACFAASATDAEALIVFDLNDRKPTVVRRSSAVVIPEAHICVAQSISFPSSGGRMAHAFYYPPTNADYQPLDGELPPLIVKSHGGPTAATDGSLNPKTQYWTTRGFAVVDVNYGGSTGYGREYRNLLTEGWGIVDVQDCCNAAKYLCAEGLADPKRLAIAGSSAGGFTTLACLAFEDVFSVGASYYGISDLEALLQDTHKFEARYFDRLIGPYPERKDRYQERSPINHIDSLSCPVIFFQGLEDKVVPPNQAELMVDALRQKGVEVEYVTYAEEQHGFRQSANIIDSLEKELAFYLKVFGQ